MFSIQRIMPVRGSAIHKAGLLPSLVATALLLTRQKVPPVPRQSSGELADPRKGAYLVVGGDHPDAVLAATGSELQLALAACETLRAEGKAINVVSIPCLEILMEQDPSYAKRLFPVGVPVATIEAGSTDPWGCLAGPDGLMIGIDGFGASAPSGILAEKFGLTPELVTTRIRAWLG